MSRGKKVTEKLAIANNSKNGKLYCSILGEFSTSHSNAEKEKET